MHPFSRKYFGPRGFVPAVLSLSLAIALSSSTFAWQQTGSATAPAAKPVPALTSPEKKATARVKLETIREVTTKLSAPEFEGRGTGQPGADRAAQYIAQRFAAIGLKPAGDNGTYLQAIKFRSSQVQSESSVKIGDASLKHGEDYIVLPPYTSEQVDATGNVVFLGYGVVSDDLKRDDIAGLDLKGKVVVLIGGQPAGVDAAAWKRATNPQVRAMNIFGRGAAAMIVGNAGSAAQPYATIAKITIAMSTEISCSIVYSFTKSGA